MKRLNNPYHLVENSPWPLSISIILGTILLSFVNMMHFIKYPILIFNMNLNELIMIISLSMLIINFLLWMNEIVEESYYKGDHTLKVQNGISLGFTLFVISEALVFFSLFFAYFYNSLIPSVELGSIWPPIGIITLDYKAVPLLNTLILFFSGITITSAHNFLLANKKNLTIFYLFLTIFLGLVFTFLQYYEYTNASFNLTDSFYGSSFFILTGCHGMHILIGTIFLISALLRIIWNQLSINHHLNFSFAAIYWHFVDLVWIFLFAFLYIWAS